MKGKVNKMTIYTLENAKENYIRQIENLDNNANVLTEEEKEELKKDFLKIESEEELYLTALDWNVTVIVVKQIGKGF